MIDLKQLRAVAEAATPGPWRLWDGEIDPYHITDATGDYHALIEQDHGRIANLADVAFIVAFNPAVVLELLSRLESAEKALIDLMWDLPCPVELRCPGGNDENP